MSPSTIIVIICVVVKLILSDTTTTMPNPNWNLETFIDDLFPDSRAGNTTGVPEADECPGGKCVIHYLCKNNTFNTRGVNLIDLRFGQDKCLNPLYVCCGASEKLDKVILPSSTGDLPLFEKCGIRNGDGIGVRILEYDGDSQYAEFPWMVAVLGDKQDNDMIVSTYLCGGSLIHQKVILTVAHCVARKTADTLIARAGEWDTQSTNELWPHQDRNVESIVTHREYYKFTLANDIALLFVHESFDLMENVQIICLPPSNFQFDETHRCVASGWGKNTFDREEMNQVILKKVELPIVPFTRCENLLQMSRLGPQFKLHSTFMCAGGQEGKDMCTGDGGSPLVCSISERDPNQYYQAGIVSWGNRCGLNNTPGVYVNVSLYKNWIDLQMQEKIVNMGSYIPELYVRSSLN